jgi:hypothetical protein
MLDTARVGSVVPGRGLKSGTVILDMVPIISVNIGLQQVRALSLA